MKMSRAETEDGKGEREREAGKESESASWQHRLIYASLQAQQWESICGDIKGSLVTGATVTGPGVIAAPIATRVIAVVTYVAP